MCGIAGIVGENAVEKRGALSRMMAAIARRGPDGEGVYESPSGQCLLGHKRLSIIDLSDKAAQPMNLDNRRYAFCYNGECYNFSDLREGLKRQGEQFRSSGDTEVVLKMLVRDGKSCLPKLNAMFAFGFWDDKYHRLLLARDRFGQKPLYYCFAGKLLLFASEVRALIASDLIEKKLNLNALRSYLAYGAIHGHETIISGISLLPASHYFEWERNVNPNTGVYWAPGREKRRYDAEELRNAFASAVERHLISDVPIGAFLSGGIDSSAIVTAAAHVSDQKVTSLSVVFPDLPQMSEHVHAQRIADFANTNHIEVCLSDSSLLKLLPHCLDQMDQPSIDGFNTFIVSQAAHSNGLKVVLSGLGGDELFGGYPSFRDIPRLIKLKRALRHVDNRTSAWFDQIGLYTKKLPKLVSLLAAPSDILNLYLVRRQLFSEKQIEKLMPEFACQQQLGTNISREFEQYLREIMDEKNVYDAIGLLEMFSYMGQTLLRDVDVMSMAYSLEVRMPFLDTEFTNVALALPSIVRTPTGTQKEWFVRAMSDWLPRKNARRPKQGFSLPFSQWMRGALLSEITDGLNTFLHRYPLFEQTIVKEFWQQFLRNPESIGWSRPWSLYVLGQYIQKNQLII